MSITSTILIGYPLILMLFVTFYLIGYSRK